MVRFKRYIPLISGKIKMKKGVKNFAKKSKEKYYSLSKFEKMMFGLFAIFILFFLVAILVSGILNAYPYTPAGGATITTTNIWEIVDGITRLIVPSDINISGNLNVSKNLNVEKNLNVVGNITGKNLQVENLNVAGNVSSNLTFSKGSGINFGNKTLMNYEEGTWTPTLPHGGTLSILSARYMRIGNFVHVSTYLQSIIPTADNSQFNIGGLPYSTANYGNNYHGGSFGYVANGNFDDVYSVTGSGLDYIYFHKDESVASLSNNEFITRSGGSGTMVLSISYYV
jgi:hypothetical protein